MYSENICFVIYSLWNKREEHINTDYDVTGWMFCLIPHIRKDVFKYAQNKHHIQVNNVIKTLFSGSTEKELHATIDTLWSEYTKFNQSMIPLKEMDLSETVKILLMVTVIYGIRNTLYRQPKF